MPIFDDPIAKTRVDLITTAAQCKTQSEQTLYHIGLLIWSNKYGLTPQQAFDSLGTDAGTAVQVFHGLRALLNAAGSTIGSGVPDGWSVAVNPDGTVTVTEPPPAPSPPAAPTSIAATLADGVVQVTWTAAADVDGYNVYREVDGGGFTKLNDTLVTALEFTDSSPPFGIVRYDVRSWSEATSLESTDSTPASIQIQGQ